MSELPIELIESREANALLRQQLAAFRRTVVEHIAEVMVSGDWGDHHRVKGLATALDGAGVNVDQAVEERLAEQGYTGDEASTPFGVNRSMGLWTDCSRKTWDLTGTWVDNEGVAWKWTGDVLNGQPWMRTEPKGARPEAIFEAIDVFGAPLNHIPAAF